MPEVFTKQRKNEMSELDKGGKATVEEPKKKVGSLLFATQKDENLERDGKWHTYTVGELDGELVEVRFKIRRAGGGNKLFAKLITKKQEPYRNLIQANKGVLPDAISEKIGMEVFCQHILVDWENVQNADGDFIDCTPANIEMIMKALPDLFKDLLVLAQQGDIFIKEAKDADAKN
jgi:hypothetical protein